MTNRTLLNLVVVVMGLMGFLLLLNVTETYYNTAVVRFLAPNSVKGMAIEYNGTIYTLNFNQQHQILSAINHSVEITPKMKDTLLREIFPYRKLVIYRFDDQDITIEPYTLINGQLVYSSSSWNQEGLLQETGPGELNQLLLQTFDP